MSVSHEFPGKMTLSCIFFTKGCFGGNLKDINSRVDDELKKSYSSVYYCESYGVVHITPIEKCCAPASCAVKVYLKQSCIM